MPIHPKSYPTAVRSVIALLIETSRWYAQTADMTGDMVLRDLLGNLCHSHQEADLEMKRALGDQTLRYRPSECTGPTVERSVLGWMCRSDATVQQLLSWCESCEAELCARFDHLLDAFDLTEMTRASMVGQRYLLHRNVQRVKRVRQLRYDMDLGDHFKLDIHPTTL